MNIRKAEKKDWKHIWSIIKPVIASGDTYVFEPNTPEEEMRNHWLGPGKHTFVAILGSNVVGTYILKDNQPGLGRHVANGSYMVHPEYFGKGIGKRLGLHSLEQARQLGYQAIQFNIVIKTNEKAVALWQKLGWEIIGEVPEAFQHQTKGLTNAYIMYRKI